MRRVSVLKLLRINNIKANRITKRSTHSNASNEVKNTSLWDYPSVTLGLSGLATGTLIYGGMLYNGRSTQEREMFEKNPEVMKLDEEIKQIDESLLFGPRENEKELLDKIKEKRDKMGEIRDKIPADYIGRLKGDSTPATLALFLCAGILPTLFGRRAITKVYHKVVPGAKLSQLAAKLSFSTVTPSVIGISSIASFIVFSGLYPPIAKENTPMIKKIDGYLVLGGLGLSLVLALTFILVPLSFPLTFAASRKVLQRYAKTNKIVL